MSKNTEQEKKESRSEGQICKIRDVLRYRVEDDRIIERFSFSRLGGMTIDSHISERECHRDKMEGTTKLNTKEKERLLEGRVKSVQ